MKKEKLWQRSKQRIFFDNEDMDFYLSWALALQHDHGSTHGECFYAASQIRDGDLASWTKAWRELAQRVETHAHASADKGHRVSAREAYLRAFTYYQTDTITMHLHDPAFHGTWRQGLACFRQALPFMDIPIEAVAIPFEGQMLPGYFMRPSAGNERRKTLIMIGGGETCAEQLYFWSGAPGVRRGYNVLFVDLPGQGSTPFAGLYFRVDYETPIRVVVDYALNRPEVDPARLALYGVSGGGYMVCRAAVSEQRIKALVANAPIVDFHRLATAEIPNALLNAPAFVGNALLKFTGMKNPFPAVALEKMVWQAGCQNLLEVLQKSRDAKITQQQIGDIACPTLCLCSEGESQEQLAQTHEFYDALTVKKHLRLFRAEEGADAHCQVNNFPLAQQVLFDWLDETFSTAGE